MLDDTPETLKPLPKKGKGTDLNFRSEGATDLHLVWPLRARPGSPSHRQHLLGGTDGRVHLQPGLWILEQCHLPHFTARLQSYLKRRTDAREKEARPEERPQRPILRE